jgi:hypothetical protein
MTSRIRHLDQSLDRCPLLRGQGCNAIQMIFEFKSKEILGFEIDVSASMFNLNPKSYLCQFCSFQIKEEM